MRRFLAILLIGVLCVCAFAGCGGSGNTTTTAAPTTAAPTTAADTAATTTAAAATAAATTEAATTAATTQAANPVTLNFMLNSPELTEYYNDMVAHYTAENPHVKIDMEILQNDYQTVLKTRLNSGDVPDMFLTSAYNDNIVFSDYIYNLNNEPFIKNIQPAILTSATHEGNITGYPFVVQGHSFIYNKTLFAQAGITELPKTLEDYKTVCEKLTAIGIQPFSTGFAEWWVLPQTTYPSMSDAYDGDYEKLFAEVEAGTLNFGDLPQVDFAFDLLDLIKQYGGDKPMESTFDIQVSDFANGTVAIIHQGTWAEDGIRSVTPDIDLGFLEAPRLDGKSVVAVESNLTFRVYKDSKNRDEVLKLLDWLTNSPYGKNWIPNEIKQISPQIGAAAPDTQLAKATAASQDANITCPWWIFKGPDGIENPFGTAFQNYVAGTASREATKQVLSQLFVDAFDAQQ